MHTLSLSVCTSGLNHPHAIAKPRHAAGVIRSEPAELTPAAPFQVDSPRSGGAAVRLHGGEVLSAALARASAGAGRAQLRQEPAAEGAGPASDGRPAARPRLLPGKLTSHAAALLHGHAVRRRRRGWSRWWR